MSDSVRYSQLPNLVLAFHGCDQSVYEKVLYDHEPLTPSIKPYDWLGNGIYFWENSYERALDWAKEHKSIKTPAVIGAVIELGHCLNITDYKSTGILKIGYDLLKLQCELASTKLPVNSNARANSDLLIRELDCAVIQQIHQYNKATGKKPFESVRGVFVEGEPVYPNSGFMEKTHIQLCIINPNCIKGYFSPITASDGK
jgi:hypothetical protein